MFGGREFVDVTVIVLDEADREALAGMQLSSSHKRVIIWFGGSAIAQQPGGATMMENRRRNGREDRPRRVIDPVQAIGLGREERRKRGAVSHRGN
jgi:hypothetical protein